MEIRLQGFWLIAPWLLLTFACMTLSCHISLQGTGLSKANKEHCQMNTANLRAIINSRTKLNITADNLMDNVILLDIYYLKTTFRKQASRGHVAMLTCCKLLMRTKYHVAYLGHPQLGIAGPATLSSYNLTPEWCNSCFPILWKHTQGFRAKFFISLSWAKNPQ